MQYVIENTIKTVTVRLNFEINFGNKIYFGNKI